MKRLRTESQNSMEDLINKTEVKSFFKNTFNILLFIVSL
jgi:hypothetical protein